MRKRHFIALGEAVTRVLDRLAEWSEPGTAGRMVELAHVERIVIQELSMLVTEQKGDGLRWKREVQAAPLTRKLEQVRDKAIERYEVKP